jgi:hypothetical protein
MKILLRHSSLGNRSVIAKNNAVIRCINEPSVSGWALARFVRAVAARFRAAAEAQAPEGYEDGKGFHFGSHH